MVAHYFCVGAIRGESTTGGRKARPYDRLVVSSAGAGFIPARGHRFFAQNEAPPSAIEVKQLANTTT